MPRHVSTALLAIGLPSVVLLGGGWLMAWASDRAAVAERLEHAAPEDRRPLNMRIRGYDREAVLRHWTALDGKARFAERRFLELDLVFPAFYGGALAGGLLLMWRARGRRFSPAWLVAPVLLGVVADWTENLIQLQQLTLLAHGGDAAVEPGAVRMASAATMAKLWSLNVAGLSLIALAVAVLRSPSAPAAATGRERAHS